jgi:KaiC/GvpD/RAD55 family RecA-like ATPase
MIVHQEDNQRKTIKSNIVPWSGVSGWFMAFRTAIDGLDRVIRTDITPPKVILVTGPPGSMKTSFCYTLMSRYLKDTGEFGLYTTLEETVQSHLRNMESLGVELSMNMQISDFTDLREIDAVVGPEDQTDYLAFIERMISHYRKVHGHKFRLFALDSLGALYSLMENTHNMRKRMFYFFKMLRDNDLTSLIVMERNPDGESQILGNEGFLVDGIVLLGLDRSRGKLVRYLQVEKMRSTDHSMEKHAIEVRKGGLTVLGPIFDTGRDVT